MDSSATNRDPRGLNYLRLAFIGVLIALLVAFYYWGASDYLSWETLKAKRNSWREVVDLNQSAAIVVFLFISISMMAVSLPVGSILSFTAGALFDQWLGVAVITVASSIGSTLAFLVSRHVLRDFVRYWFGRWFRIVDRGIERDGARYLLMLRLSPIVPFFAVNATMGLTHMRTRTFFLVTLIGVLPSCFLYVMIGAQVMEIDSPRDVLSVELIVLLSLLALTPLIFGWLMRRKDKVKADPVAAESPS